MSERGHAEPEGPTPRAQPFYCPYCGEQDIRPEEADGAWRCYLCDRVFSVEFKGLARH